MLASVPAVTLRPLDVLPSVKVKGGLADRLITVLGGTGSVITMLPESTGPRPLFCTVMVYWAVAPGMALERVAPSMGSVLISTVFMIISRSEERRVGKECRSRWAT